MCRFIPSVYQGNTVGQIVLCESPVRKSAAKLERLLYHVGVYIGLLRSVDEPVIAKLRNLGITVGGPSTIRAWGVLAPRTETCCIREIPQDDVLSALKDRRGVLYAFITRGVSRQRRFFKPAKAVSTKSSQHYGRWQLRGVCTGCCWL